MCEADECIDSVGRWRSVLVNDRCEDAVRRRSGPVGESASLPLLLNEHAALELRQKKHATK